MPDDDFDLGPTLDESGLDYPRDAYTALTTFHSMLGRLPGDIEAVRGFLQRLQESGQMVSADPDCSTDELMESIRTRLGIVEQFAPVVQRTLDEARTLLGPLGW